MIAAVPRPRAAATTRLRALLWLVLALAAAGPRRAGAESADAVDADGKAPANLPDGLFSNEGPTFVLASAEWTLYMPLVNARRSGKVWRRQRRRARARARALPGPRAPMAALGPTGMAPCSRARRLPELGAGRDLAPS
jgi:hypothetical protein